MTAEQIPAAQAVLRAYGTACAHLTPLISEEIRRLPSGDVLEVWSDDPAAREGVPAWSRLTGHVLLASVADDAHSTRFFLRRK